VQYYYHEQLTDLDETGFGMVYIDQTQSYMPPHWHMAVELLCLVRGKVTVRFGQKTHVIAPGELFLFNSYEIHESWCSRDAAYLCVHILPARMCKYVSNFDQLRFSLHFDPSDSEKALAFSRLKAHMSEMLLLREEQPEGYLLQCQALLYSTATLLVRHFSQPLVLEETSLQRSDMTRLEPLIEYTEHHHHEDLTLDQAADSMGLSKEYFCRLFKKNMGVSYLQFLSQIRASAVCRDLQITEEPIGLLAERHGFKSPKLFNQVFRELYGCTPSEKRKQFKGADLSSE